MAFISRLRQLQQGTLRLLVVVSIIISLLLFISAMSLESEALLVLSIFSFFSFWILVRAILWIKDGYKNDIH